MPEVSGNLLFLTVLFPVIFIILGLIFIRMLRKAPKTTKEKRSETAFIVETFHELVGKLKEKERELEVLRQKAEERAVEIESYSTNIIQSVPSGVVSLDDDLVVTFANTPAAEILREKESLAGKSYVEIFREPLLSVLKERETVKRREYLYELRTGEKIWLGLTTSRLYNSSGEPIGMVMVFTDLTELKALERQIQFREWLTSLGEISLGIAHELRNPLAVISGYVKILEKKKAGFEEEIEAISREIKVMDRTIENFLSFARPVTPANVDVDLRPLLEDLVWVERPEGVDLDLKLEECMIESDEILLRQAFTNLIKNAFESMEDGGILRIRLTCKGSRAIVEIEDTGRGIPEQISEKIFLPFYTTKEKGTGLGLSIVQKNITLIGGSLNFSSGPGGTRFVLEIPLKRRG